MPIISSAVITGRRIKRAVKFMGPIPWRHGLTMVYEATQLLSQYYAIRNTSSYPKWQCSLAGRQQIDNGPRRQAPDDGPRRQSQRHAQPERMSKNRFIRL